MSVLNEVSPEQWTQFNRALDVYYEYYRIYIDQLNHWHKKNAGAFRFGVMLTNVGTSPATDIDVSLVFDPRIEWLVMKGTKEETLLRIPEPPSPPKPPRPKILEAMTFMDNAHLRFNTPRLRNVPLGSSPDAPDVTVVTRPSAGHEILANLRRLKHGTRVLLGDFRAVFGSSEDINPFEVKYTISTNEHPTKLAGSVPMIISKVTGTTVPKSEDPTAGGSGK